MKVNHKILSIPPYISTCWSNVKTLHMKGPNLVVQLKDQGAIEVPNLDPATLNKIFITHAEIVEQISNEKILPPMETFEQRMDFPFKLAVGTLDEFGGSIMQHNSSQANGPEIPEEILSKIIAITKIISPDETISLPKAEPQCNCVHCQISRVVNEETAEKKEEEEIVSDQELNFQQWEIENRGNQLYTVVNKLDPNEKYNVFLGDPIGCTCGNTGCEHIVAVLKT